MAKKMYVKLLERKFAGNQFGKVSRGQESLKVDFIPPDRSLHFTTEKGTFHILDYKFAPCIRFL